MSLRIIVLIAAAVITARTHAAIIYGYCYLEGQDNHCLTLVEIDHSAIHPPVYTDSTGYYRWLAVVPGWHTFTYSHPGYHTETHEFYVPLFGGKLPDVELETKAICDPQSWQYYPYTIPGTDIAFPKDDGKHNPTSDYRIEWWYMNFHLTDEDNTDYGGFVAFFKPPVIGLPSLVLVSAIDLDTGISYSAAKIQELFTAHDQYLDIAAGLPPRDRWYNRQCEGYLRPFEYHLYASGLDNGILWLDLDMASLKPPMAVGGEGYVEYGDDVWSYYYSCPSVDILGKLHLPGFPALGKDVEGYGWIDHQWADFNTESVSWEWLSIQLDDDREIMAADVWVGGEPLGSFSGGLNLYDEQCNLTVLEDYTLTPLASWTDPVTGKEFSTQWSITEPSEQIDLVVTAVLEEQVMRIGENQIFRTCFWEGACTVTGTIGGQPVAGTAYAEVTHLTEAPCAEDIDGSGTVDFDDVIEVLNHWGPCPEPCPDYCYADVTEDCTVDLDDLFAVLAAWGPCP